MRHRKYGITYVGGTTNGRNQSARYADGEACDAERPRSRLPGALYRILAYTISRSRGAYMEGVIPLCAALALLRYRSNGAVSAMGIRCC